MLHILATYAKREDTLDRVMEFGGPGLASLSPDERATLANMATECSAKAGVVEVDETTLAWIAERRQDLTKDALRAQLVQPDAGRAPTPAACTASTSRRSSPMVATPGDPDRGIASDPKNGALTSRDLPRRQDRHRLRRLVHRRQERRHRHVRARSWPRPPPRASGRRRACGSTSSSAPRRSRPTRKHEGLPRAVRAHRRRGDQARAAARASAAAPASRDREDQVTVSAINRNYKGRSGPGKLYLASPSTVAASAVAGRIRAYRRGMFAKT